MSIRISNICLGLDEPEASLAERASRLLGLPADAIAEWRILRKSLDMRRRESLHFVYSIEANVLEDTSILARCAARARVRGLIVEPYRELPFSMPPPGDRPLTERPVIVGSGPAGLFAGYFLAAGGYMPLILERGRPVGDRIRDVKAFDAGGDLDPESNYLFGEGGAGTFSDGKLTSRSSGPDTKRVLEILADCKGKPSILYDYRPHLGSNRLPAVVKALRRRIESDGGEFRFRCRVEDLDLHAGETRGLVTSTGYQRASVVVLAIGHSARDTYHMLNRRGIPMVPKAFQMGVRVEQPQAVVNRLQYGDPRLSEKLGAADYALIARGKHNLFTFCMCAGGQVIPSVSAPGYFCTNGMSLSRRSSPFANSGLMITVDPEHFGADDVLAGVRLQEQFETRAFAAGRGEYACPIQWASDFLAGRASTSMPPSSYSRGLALADVAELVPPLVREALLQGLPIMNERWRGQFLKEASLVGPESRGSAPLRILREPDTMETPGFEGLYPVGEGAGYAGGIVSAAVDGLRAARAIMAKYARLTN